MPLSLKRVITKSSSKISLVLQHVFQRARLSCIQVFKVWKNETNMWTCQMKFSKVCLSFSKRDQWAQICAKIHAVCSLCWWSDDAAICKIRASKKSSRFFLIPKPLRNSVRHAIGKLRRTPTKKGSKDSRLFEQFRPRHNVLHTKTL